MISKNGRSSGKSSDATKKKTNYVERDLYVKPLLKLTQQEEVLEKVLITAIGNMKISPNLSQNIIQEYRQLSLNRKNFLHTIRKDIEDVGLEFENVKTIANNPEEVQKLNVNSYKEKLMKLWKQVQGFEKSCPLQTLQNEGAALASELQDFQHILQKCENIQKHAMLLPMSSQCKVYKNGRNVEYKDVDDFHTLVAMTGHTENWIMEDHLFFLKMRENVETIATLVTVIQKKCPDLSTEAIVNHEAWYKHYQNLREKQRKAIQKWRQQKTAEENRNINVIESAVGINVADNVTKINKEKEMTISKLETAPGTKTRCTNSGRSLHSSEKKELIRQWRIEKENKRSMDEEQIKMQKILKQQTEENRRKKRREKIQGALEEYKQKRYLENTVKKQSELLKEKCKYDTTLIKAFRKQNEEFIRKREALILRSKKPNKNNVLRLKKVELVQNENCSSLMNATKVWQEKCRMNYLIRDSNDVQYIKDIPRTCIRWRNQESEDLLI